MRKHLVIFMMRILVFALLILALTQPTLHYQGERQPSDYVIAIDTSASMSATDIQPTRFDAAKNLANNFTQEIGSQAAIAIVGFSGYAQIAQPLTNNTQLVQAAINDLQIPTISGTDIAGAIITSTNALSITNQGRAIILITDGVNTAGQAQTDSIATAVGYAREYDVTIHAIAIGRESSAPLGYLPTLYNVSAQYNTQDLQRITNQTNGQLYTAQTTQEFQEAFANLQEEPESTSVSYSLTQILMLIGLLFIFIDWALINSKLRIIP
jgi:Ca-activated chloride channel family protein